jgi:hypothetical protein
MRGVKFPKRRDDGSFVVVARFTVSDRTVLALVRDYVKAWVRAHGTWIRLWRSNSIEEERLQFDSEFQGEPRVEAAPDGSSFFLLLEGRPSATRWKDWVVLMANDISNVFPEVKFEGFESEAD